MQLGITLSPRWMLLLVAGSVLTARLLHRERGWRVAIQVIAASVLGGIPAVLFFRTARHTNPIGIIILLELGFASGTLLGGLAPILTAFFTRRRQCLASSLATALLGGFFGSYLAFEAIMGGPWHHEVPPHVYALGAALIGSFATLGYQLGAGSPEPTPV